MMRIGLAWPRGRSSLRCTASQNWRMNLPPGVPGSVEVMSTLRSGIDPIARSLTSLARLQHLHDVLRSEPARERRLTERGEPAVDGERRAGMQLVQRMEDEVAVALFELLEPGASERVVDLARGAAIGDEALRGARRPSEDAFQQRARLGGAELRTVESARPVGQGEH